MAVSYTHLDVYKRQAFVNPKDVLDLQTAEVKPDTSDDDLAVIAGMKAVSYTHLALSEKLNAAIP